MVVLVPNQDFLHQEQLLEYFWESSPLYGSEMLSSEIVSCVALWNQRSKDGSKR